MMVQILRAIFKWLPVAILVIYAYLISEYRYFLSANLKYVPPPIPVAPEDVLGLGVWVSWSLVVVVFFVACVLSYAIGLERKRAYWAPLYCAFGILSVVHFSLYHVIERQVLSG